MSYAIKVMSIYQSDAYDDHWTIVKIFLCTLEELRVCFVCGSDKQFIVRCYIDTGFVINTNKFYLN
jgi:hypothetical protein